MSCAWVLTAVLLASTLGAGARAAVDSPAVTAASAAPRQYYELRTYHFASADQQQRYSGFIQGALLPALNRAGSTPVGVFTVENRPDDHTLTMVIPFSSIEAYASLDSHLENDTTYQAAGAEVLDLPSSDPPYTRIDSSLLAAFERMPHLTLPAQSAAKQGRAFELRNY